MRGQAILLSVLLLGTLACASAQSPEPAEPASPASDLLRPGDVVRLEIWREPTLSGEFQVDEQGVVVFPKIGAFEVGEVPAESLRSRILAEYRHYLRNPSIDVTFLRRITIMGAVRAPGLYPVDPTMTVSDALALAGGALSYGEPSEVELFREGERRTANVTQRMRLEELAIRSGDQLYVPERSWVERHSGLLATFISSAVSLFIAWKF